MTNPIQTDICIIGGGPAGYVAAIRAAQLGRSVVLVERDELGGTCLNRGCIPTKSLLKTAETLSLLARAKELGVYASQSGVDPAALMQRKDRVVKNLRMGLEHLMRKNAVTVLKGSGRVESPHLVKAEAGGVTTEVCCGRLILATGSAPLLPPVKGIGLDGVMTSDDALNISEIPKSMVVIGSGAIGMELCTFYQALGVKVTVVELQERILPAEEEEASAAILNIYRRRGVRFHVGVGVSEIRRAEEGLELLLGTGGTLTAEKVLVAAGRRRVLPDELKLEGLRFDGRAVAVDDHMRTGVEDVYCVGDLTAGPLLAHAAFAEGRVAAENACGLDSSMAGAPVPACVYTSPEVASVGLTQRQAEAKSISVKTGRFDFRANGRALCHGERDGFVKVVADENNTILGGCIVGLNASEMISELTLAVDQHIRADVLAGLIHPHPSMSEAVMEACAQICGRPVHQ